jgi:hypothetical protein
LNWERNPVDEMHHAENNEQFAFDPAQSNRRTTTNDDDDDDEKFDDATETSVEPLTTHASIPRVVSDRSRTQSPMNSSPSSSTSQKANTAASSIRETSKASSIRSTAATMGSLGQTSIIDLERELQEFDIDLDEDDVSDPNHRSSAIKRANKSSTVENEVISCHT